MSQLSFLLSRVSLRLLERGPYVWRSPCTQGGRERERAKHSDGNGKERRKADGIRVGEVHWESHRGSRFLAVLNPPYWLVQGIASTACFETRGLYEGLRVGRFVKREAGIRVVHQWFSAYTPYPSSSSLLRLFFFLFFFVFLLLSLAISVPHLMSRKQFFPRDTHTLTHRSSSSGLMLD